MRSDENVGGLVELLRCPCCNSAAQLSDEYEDCDGNPAVECSQCNLLSWAVSDWNTRVSAHGQPVVDERISRAWKLVERWEQPTIDGDTLTKEERLRNMGFAAMLRAALGATP